MSKSTSQAAKKSSTMLYIGLGAGCFIVVMLIAAVLLLTPKKRVADNKVVTKQYEVSQIKEQDSAMLKRTDVLAKEISALKDALNQQPQELENLREEVRETFTKLNEDFTTALNDTRNAVNQLNERLNQLERLKTGVKEIRVIKPSKTANLQQEAKKPSKSSAKSSPKVQAVVNDRAWVVSGEDETSVTTGDVIPPREKPKTVEQIDPINGVVMTSSP